MTKDVIERAIKTNEKETAAALSSPSLFAKLQSVKSADDMLADADRAIEQANVDEFVDAKHIELASMSDVVLDDSQLAALEGLTHQRFGVLIGAAGTGKTTTTKRLVKRLELTAATIDLNKTRMRVVEDAEPDYNVAISFNAFTGRAVQQMKRALPKEYHPMCQTMHAMLGFHPEYFETMDEDAESDTFGMMNKKMKFVPYFDNFNKLPWRVFVFDEAGMIPIDLWNQFMEACHDDVRIILIGDINQLPPVQGRSVLGFAMAKWPTYALETIHRQAADNPIIANAHKILQGKYPLKAVGQFDMVTVSGGSQQTYNDLLRVIKALHQKGDFDPMHDAIIVPTNDHQLGQRLLNEHLVLYFNPPQRVGGAVLNPRINISTGVGTGIYAIGDKVMLLANDRERGLTNGMIGVVSDITINGAYDSSRRGAMELNEVEDEFGFEEINVDGIGEEVHDAIVAREAVKDMDKGANQRQASHIMTVKFQDGQEVKMQTAGNYKNITYGYAFTCHKAQGGEFKRVIILCHSANSKMLTREWLYTAVTRAQERVILVCNERGLEQAINTQRVKGRSIKDKIAGFIALEALPGTNMPFLPAPEGI